MKAQIINVRRNSDSLFLGKIPSLAAPLIARILKDKKIDVEIIDENQGQVTPEDLRGSDIVLLTSYTHNASRAYSIAKQVEDNPIIIMGGPHATFLPEEALSNGVDIVVRGLADQTLPDLIDALVNSNPLNEVAGISYKDLEDIRHNPDREISPVDDMPIPYFGAISNLRKPYRRYPLQLSRGCSHRCDFCQIHRSIPIQQIKGVDRVAQDIDQIEEDYSNGLFQEIAGKKRVLLVDDNFGSKETREKTMILLEHIIERGLNFRLTTQARIEFGFDDELLNLFYLAGGRRVLLGIESLGDEQLKEMEKGTTRKKILDSLDRIKRYGFEVWGLFIVGYDHDTQKSILNIPEYANEIDLDCSNVTILTPFPGTKVYDRMITQNRIDVLDWSRYDGYHCVFKPNQIKRPELERIVRSIMKDDPSSIYNYMRSSNGISN